MSWKICPETLKMTRLVGNHGFMCLLIPWILRSLFQRSDWDHDGLISQSEAFQLAQRSGEGLKRLKLKKVDVPESTIRQLFTERLVMQLCWLCSCHVICIYLYHIITKASLLAGVGFPLGMSWGQSRGRGSDLSLRRFPAGVNHSHERPPPLGGLKPPLVRP